MNTRKSKIIAKIADNNCEIDFLEKLFNAGADVAWLNTAHQDEPATLEVINRIRQVSPLTPILLDTKGPEIRTKDIENPIQITAGEHIYFTGKKEIVGDDVVHVSYPNFEEEVPVGKSILYDDALIEFVVEEKTDKGLRCSIKSSGVIKNKKSLNIPDVHIKLPALTEKDTSFIHFCAKHNVDFVIHSFVRNKKDIEEIKAITSQYPEYEGKIIAKIENREGFENIEEILDNCDGLMVARGDLGAEVPLCELPYMQKKMLEASLKKGKYSIVATQALESMIKNPRPTRAEVTDVANAILDGSCGVSMSGETAYGDYPIEATTTMAKIMEYTESKIDELSHQTISPDTTDILYKKAKEIIEESERGGVLAICVIGEDIAFSRALSSLRPSTIIIPVIQREEDVKNLMLGYALRPICSKSTNFEEIVGQIKLPSGSKIAVYIKEKGLNIHLTK